MLGIDGCKLFALPACSHTHIHIIQVCISLKYISTYLHTLYLYIRIGITCIGTPTVSFSNDKIFCFTLFTHETKQLLGLFFYKI